MDFTECFEVVDRLGEVHTYEVELHDGEQGADLGMRLHSLVLGAALSLLGGDASSVAQVLGSLDADTRLQLLRYASRDGKPLVASGRFTQAFRDAYRANHTELVAALGRVAQANGFLPSWSTLRTSLPPAVVAKLEVKLAKMAAGSLTPSESRSSPTPAGEGSTGS